MPTKLTLESYDADISGLYKDETSSSSFIKEQQDIHDKLISRRQLTEDEASKYVLTKEDRALFEAFKNVADGKDVKNFNLKDYIASPQAAVLIPKIIIGAARRAAEPVYMASKFFKQVKSKNGVLTIMPTIGTMQAHELAEGQAPPIEGLDFALMQSNSFVTATKKGIRIQVTDQYINDSQWDLLTILIEEAGFAMARLKEQLACVELSKRGYTVFNNSIKSVTPEAGTTGTNYNGTLNDTMTIDDFLELIIALMNNEQTPTDVLMHPLVWLCFARNGLAFMAGAASNGQTNGITSMLNSPTATIPLGPAAVNGRLPFGINVDLSPFIPIDTTNKLFDLYCIDKNNVGLMIVQDNIKTDEFRDPVTDIYNFKMMERYNFATLNEGRGIAVARNISMDRSYPEMTRVKQF